MIRVAALQLPHLFGDKHRQLERVDGLLAGLSGVELAVLGETALTGYLTPQGDFDLGRFAEAAGGPTERALSALAARHGVALLGPVVERAGPCAYNGVVLFDRTGAEVGRYRKHHPWYPERWATPGEITAPLWEVCGLKIVPAICFDVHFLEEDAAENLAAADLLLFPSAWVQERPDDDTRAAILLGLAQRFSVAVVNANWGEGPPKTPGQGASRILAADGRELCRAGGGGPEAIVATLAREDR